MLSRLHIRNYAIIDEVDIRFSSNLNIITGETGAGKSILIGALSLILGERADSSVLTDADKKCIIEGYFTIAGNAQAKEFLSANDLDVDDEIVLRREITGAGKSRSFINDTPANLVQLRTLSALLVDLHQQFDTLDVGSEDFQRKVIDALAGNAALLQSYRLTFARLQQTAARLEQLKKEQAEAAREQDYNQFLFDELDTMSLRENELEELDMELSLLNNAENVKQQLGAIYTEFKNSDTPIVQQLRVAEQKLGSLEQFHPEITELKVRLHSAVIEIKDVADELERIDDSVNYDAAKIAKLNERISEGYRLQKKHGVTSTNELIRIHAELSQKLEKIAGTSTIIADLEQQFATLESEARKLAATISKARIKHASPFVQKVNGLLVKVGMPNARIHVDIHPCALNATGTDKIAFMFDANKSDRFEPLHKVASGGELSRVMLSIKSLVAEKLEMPTLIFDEIDSGISGEAARQVGMIMKDLSAEHQMISITHQPQIAARADAHYFVYKQIINDKVVTSIKLLSADERITTIAQMMSGEKPTAAALQNAREMVGN